MEVINFNLKVRHYGETISASCSVMNPLGPYQFRVVLLEETGRANVFVFYRITQGNKIFNWFELPAKKQAIAQSIAKALEKEFKN